MVKSRADATPSEPVSKVLDAWWTVILIDPFATRLARLILPYARITPTGITVAAHLLGLASAALFVSGALVPAAVVFEVRFVLDCTDGKLARLRGSSSFAGGYLDWVGDVYIVGLNVFALALHIHWTNGGPTALAIALPAAFFAYLVAAKIQKEAADGAGVGRRRGEPQSAMRYRRWMAKRRLGAVPGRIEAEHMLCFVAPLGTMILDESWPLIVTAWAVVAHFGYRAARLTGSGYLIAASRDRGMDAMVVGEEMSR